MIEPLEARRLLATSGLNAAYFSNTDFTGTTSSRIDKTINFNWSSTSPASGVSNTTFSARWNGLVKPYTSENYTFALRHNDGARLWVNGKLLIDSWSAKGSATRRASIALSANRLYDIRLEHFTQTNAPGIALSWSTPTRAEGVIPSTRFYAYDTRGANVGDFGYDNSKEYDVSQMIKRWKPDYVTTVGDNTQIDGGWSTFDRVVGKYYQQYIGNYQGSYGPGAGSTNRFFPAAGNHDWDSSNLKTYRDYFTLPNNERYYDVRKGSIHFFFTSSDKREPDGTSSASTQAQWIKSRMQASTAPFKVVIMHHPPYTSGTMGDNTWMRWPVRDWGADVVLTGHEHLYERLSADGIPYITNGAGGQTVSFGSTDSRSIVRSNSDVGAMLISANEYAMTLQYQHRSGRVVDTITLGPSPGTSAFTMSAPAAKMATAPATAPVTAPKTQFSAFSNTAVMGPLPSASFLADDRDDDAATAA
ncbi:MAG TPA: PA14 domain-containing protein [Tepidisphaeraceae bacterium]|nr:PA14 domain-containing protein [Tepidisphaeraceae bacterium]